MKCYEELNLDRLKWNKVVILGGGSSLTQEQVDMIENDWFIIAINDSYKLAPHADILYACDNQWWNWHNGCPDFKGLKITMEQEERWSKILNGEKVDNPPHKAADAVLVSNGVTGYEAIKNRIRHGSNGGYQALHLALRMRCEQIVLLGYDMHANSGVSHWHGEHPNGKQRDSRYTQWIPMFDELREAALGRKVEIINCTPDSALNCFVKKDLKEVV